MQADHNADKWWRPGTRGSALILLAALGCWVIFLGSVLFPEFSARVHSGLAVLPSAGVLITNFSASALAPVLLLCAYFLREKTQEDSELASVFLNLLGILIGGGIGWALGVFLVPFDDQDGAIYSKIGAGVTTFLSGFVLSYIPNLVKTQLASRTKAFLVQIGLGTVALLVTGLAVTTNRTEYLEYARLERAELALVDAQEKAAIEAIRAKFAVDRKNLQIERRCLQDARTQKAIKLLEDQPGYFRSLFMPVKKNSKDAVDDTLDDVRPECMQQKSALSDASTQGKK